MRDLRYAVRVLLKSRVFTATAVLTLALCIGANTAIYSVVDRVLLRALPYPHPERLAQVMTHFSRGGNDEDGQTGGTWEALRDGLTSADLASFSGLGMGVNLVAGDQPQYVKQQRVSAGFFGVLGVAPMMGREFTPAEDRPEGPALAVLSHGLWTRLGADPSIVGRAITLRGESHIVVGVMPAGFTSGSPVDVWTPLRPWKGGEGGGQNYSIIARLRPGVTWAEADAQVGAIGNPAMRDLYRNPENAARLQLIPLQRGETRDVREPILVLWGAVAAVLLIGCVNIAGLLMARGVTRAPEIAMRMALGGSRAEIVRQLLTESLVLAAAGGVLGLALGYAGSRAFAALLEDAFGLTGDTGLDARVLAITTAIALGTSVVFGLLPALQASRVNLRETLVESGSPSIAGAARNWPRRLMVVAEVALGVVLLVGAGLLIRTFDHLMRLRSGFDGTHVMTATLSLQDARYQSADRVNQLFDQSLARMRAVLGVEHAAIALTLPYERALNTGFRLATGDPEYHTINMTYVTPEYFAALRVPVMAGRVFTDADTATAAPVVIVNEALVRRFSPDQSPIGRQFAGTGGRTIVGVVGDIQTKSGFGNFGPIGAAPAAYVPAAQVNAAFMKMVHTWFSPSWFVRTAGPQQGIVSVMQGAVQSVDPLLPFAKFRTLDDVRGEAVATPRAQALLLGTLAGLALLLAAVGLYGLVATSVAVRTRELGIRLALGASSRQAVAAAAAPGIALAAAGVAIGLVAARLGATTLQHLVWGVSVTDPVTFGAAALSVLLVAVVAAFVPALRIARLNPIRALREM
ncbi:MAG: ABC transporter permease [Acidobacteriia bacterium]|nr:ABC transporter permease [Terriglobia bacterium]